MGATYTRQSSSTIVDGATIEASHFNAEFDQLVTAFAADTGHTHDGTSAEGGDVTKLLGTAITIGDGTAGTDIAVTFDGETNDGLLTWMEDEDHFKFSDDVVIDSTKRLYLNDEGGEYIYGDGTDLYLVSGADINIPANIGLTFGDDGEKIEGDGTDLTITGNNINLTATADVVIPANVGITFGSGEKIEGDSTDLTVTSGADINLTATSDVNIPSGVGVTFGDDGEKIEGDGTNLTISTSNNVTVDAAADIILDAGGADVTLKDDGTTFGSLTNSGGELVIKSGSTPTTAMTFSGANVTFGGTVTIGSAGISEAELEILDGATVTTTELNLIDGDTARGTTSVASGDGILINDGGTMRMTNVDTVSTYFASHSVGGSNIVTTGALDSGSITSGFGAIDNGTSGIRTNTFTAETSIVPDASDGATLGSASLEWSDLYLADGGIIYFGDDQDVTLTHVADSGLKLKNTNTDGNSGIGAQLTLQTGDTDMAAGNSHGQILFQAPDEGTGTDAVLAAAKIAAVAEGDFSSSSNATSLNFYCSVSEDVASTTERVSIGSAGAFVTKPLAGGHAVFNESGIDADFRIETDARTHMFFVDGGNDNITIDAGNVLQGSAGDGTFHITKASAGSVTANTTWDELVIENNTHTGISILTPNTATGALVFGDPDDNDVGSIQYDHSTDKLTFVIAASTEMQMTTAAIFPNSADGLSLGLASNEWSDLYLADSSVIYFGNDQDVTITHDPDDGLFLKSTATADNNPFLLTLQTGETDIAADDVLGAINFQAPDEGTGTDAILVAAGIEAVSEGNFSSSNNATKLSFKTAASETAAEKMLIDSAGNVGIGDSSPSDYYGNTNLVISDTTSAEVAALTFRSATDGTGFIAFADSNSGNARFAGYIQYQHATDMMSFAVGSSAEIRLTGAAMYPSSADGTALGLATNEWSDLYLADSSVIYFGNAQDVTLTHSANLLTLSDGLDANYFAVKTQKIQSFYIILQNVSGTLKHKIQAEWIATGALGNFSDKITGAASGANTTPTVDGSTDFTAGVGVNGSAVVLNTAAQTSADAIGDANIKYNSTGTDLTCSIYTTSRDVNGTTRIRPEVKFYNATTGAVFNLNTTNIATSKQIVVNVTAMIA